MDIINNTWKYILISFSSTNANEGDVSLYVDGTDVVGTSVAKIQLAAQPFIIGTNTDSQFCNIAFWSKAKTGQELKPIWGDQGITSDLQACYSFLDRNLNDISGKGYQNAELINGASIVMLANALILNYGAAQPSVLDQLSYQYSDTPFTVSVWVNMRPPAPTGIQLNGIFS